MKAVHSIPLVAALMSATGLAVAADPAKSTDKAVKPVASTVATATTATTVAAAGTAAAGTAATRPATRDWAQVDTNRDSLVSPEEMEAYLAANPGPLKGK